MNRKTIVIFLVAISLITFIIRVVYTYQGVFGGDFVNFIETDAWNRMMYAQKIAVMPFWDSISYTIQNNLLFSFVIGTLGRFLPIEYVGAWLPPVLGVATVIVVYFIGRALFNNLVGLMSALFTAIIPSEFLHRSLLGFTDHHVLEVLLMALIILFLIKSIQSPAVFDKYSVWAGVAFFLYMANWHTGLYTMISFLVVFGIALFIWNLSKREKWYAHLMAVVIPVVIAMVFYLPLGGYKELLFLVPGSQAVEVTTTQEILNTGLQAPSERTISELMPLFSPYGKISPVVVVTNLHIFFVLFLIGAVLLWKYRKDKVILLMAIWTFVMLAITVNERRFLYYFTLPVAILSALTVYHAAASLKNWGNFNKKVVSVKNNIAQNAILLSIPLLVITLPLAKNMANPAPSIMPIEWHTALSWLKTQPDGNVTAWGDYGHWIQYVSGKIPSYMPGPGGELVAGYYLSEDEDTAKKLLDSLNTRYLILDELTLTRKYFALKIYSGLNPPDRNQTLGYEIYFQNKIPGYLKLLYENGYLRLFEYRP